jgi:hypothetical protein
MLIVQELHRGMQTQPQLGPRLPPKWGSYVQWTCDDGMACVWTCVPLAAVTPRLSSCCSKQAMPAVWT